MNKVTNSDQNGVIANSDKAATCQAEGLGPGLTENVPAGTQVGQNEHYTLKSGSYITSKRIQEATGFKTLSMSTNNIQTTQFLTGCLILNSHQLSTYKHLSLSL